MTHNLLARARSRGALHGAVLLVAAVSGLVGCRTAQPPPASRSALPQRSPLLEHFNDAELSTELRHFADVIGDQVAAMDGDISIVPRGGPDQSAAARFAFTATLRSADLVTDWQNAYLAHNAWLGTDRSPGAASGIAFDLRPEGYSFAKIELTQRDADGNEIGAFAFLHVEEGVWQPVVLPFASLTPNAAEQLLLPGRPLALTVHVPLAENYHRLHFRTGTTVSGATSIDNLELVQLPQRGAGSIANFDAPGEPLLVVPELLQTSFYLDYSNSAEGVRRPTPGVTGQRLSVRHADGGPERGYLSITGSVAVDTELIPFLDAGNSFVLRVRLHPNLSWQGHREVNLLLRSASFSGATFVYEDWHQGRRYVANAIAVDDEWTRVRVPYSRFLGAESTLAQTTAWTQQPVLMLQFGVPAQALRDAVLTGSYRFEVAMDTIVLQ